MNDTQQHRLRVTALALALGFAAPATAVEWNHNPDSEIGPLHWGALDPSFETCATGLRQSPIDISGALPEGQPALAFQYRETPLVVENNGHTIEVPYALGSDLRIGGERYRLLQFHFHAPSEHTVGGFESPMEAHLVHMNATGQLAVVGVMLELGQENPVVRAVFENAPRTEGEVHVEGEFVSAAGLLPRRRSYFTYAGSLTTPPCSEGVRWFVLEDPVSVSAAQVEALKYFIRAFPAYEGYDQNNRPEQPRNGREITAHPAN